MPENKVISLEERAKDEEKPFFEQLLQEGARKLLQAAIENEVIDYIQFHKDRRDEDGQRLVVVQAPRNTDSGPIQIVDLASGTVIRPGIDGSVVYWSADGSISAMDTGCSAFFIIFSSRSTVKKLSNEMNWGL